MGESGGGLLEERIADPLDGFEPLARIGLLEPLADAIGAAATQVLELIPDEEADQVAEFEALDRLARRVSRLGREIERGVQFFTVDFDSGGAVMLEKAIEPVRRTVERSTKIEQDRVRFRHAQESNSRARVLSSKART